MSSDWVNVLGCPLCGKAESTMTENVVMGASAIGSMTMHGVDVAVSLAVSYKKCLHCSMVYQAPRLSDEARHRFYTDGLYSQITATKKEYKTEIARAARLMKMIEKLDIESVLDIGCGHGEFLQACQKAGMQVQGVDLNTDFTMDGIPVVASLLDLDDGMYDLVSMVHYLEHTVDPLAELREAMSYSRRYVLVEVPLPRRDGKYLNLPHTLIFEPWTLVSAFERVGLNPTMIGKDDMMVVIVGERDD